MPAGYLRTLLTILMLALVAPPLWAGHNPEVPRYEINVALMPEKGELRGGVRIYLPGLGDGKAVHRIYLGHVTMFSASLDDEKIEPRLRDGAFEVRGGGTLDILFGAGFRSGVRADGPDNSGVVRGNTIGPDGVLLMSGWYWWGITMWPPTGAKRS